MHTPKVNLRTRPQAAERRPNCAIYPIISGPIAKALRGLRELAARRPGQIDLVCARRGCQMTCTACDGHFAWQTAWAPTPNPLAKLATGPKHHLADPAPAWQTLPSSPPRSWRPDQPATGSGPSRPAGRTGDLCERDQPARLGPAVGFPPHRGDRPTGEAPLTNPPRFWGEVHANCALARVVLERAWLSRWQ